LSVYSPLLLDASSIDGVAQPIEVQQELGRFVYSAFLDIPPGASVTVHLDLSGQIIGAPDYRLDVAAEPMVNADQFDAVIQLMGDATVHDAEGMRDDGSTASVTTTLDGDQTFFLDVND
jgi:hypothetical protein